MSSNYDTLYEENTAEQNIQIDFDQPICRICLESEPSNFISPCKCSGTNAYVHEACLKKWINITDLIEARTLCQQCKIAYPVITKPTVFKPSYIMLFYDCFGTLGVFLLMNFIGLSSGYFIRMGLCSTYPNVFVTYCQTQDSYYIWFGSYSVGSITCLTITILLFLYNACLYTNTWLKTYCTYRSKSQGIYFFISLNLLSYIFNSFELQAFSIYVLFAFIVSRFIIVWKLIQSEIDIQYVNYVENFEN